MEDTLPKKKYLPWLLAGTFLGIIIIYLFFLSAPLGFKKGTIASIEEGSSLGAVAAKLKSQNIIRSKFLFKAWVTLLGNDDKVKPGDYLFSNRSSLFKVAQRLVSGDSGMPRVEVTIPEGFTVEEMAKAFSSELSHFHKEEFLREARPKEGYLFPDTYFFLPTAREGDVLKSLSENYEKKVAPLRPKFLEVGKTEKEIIIMASIIEGEADGDNDREIISGILWKRLSIGMALEVDAAPDTYKERGLPKKPVNNPGLAAIEAALYPRSSDFLFYLHDREGNIHYAKNFEEHKINKRKYLE